MNKHINVVAQLSEFVKLKKENKVMEPMQVARERERNILNYLYFSKIRDIIKSFTELEKKLQQKIVFSLIQFKSD